MKNKQKDLSFKLDYSNRYLNVVYENDNYKVLHGMADNNICAVFFSGNGLYYPNTEDSFRNTILYKDRYEWASVASVMSEYVSCIVLVRDIRKSWYVDGINIKYNSIYKVLTLLKELCNGYRVFTFGNSAGGYMAMLAGYYLKAERIYNWGGQIDLHIIEDNLFENEFLKNAMNDPEKNKYFDLRRILSENHIPIFAFYAGKNKKDMQDVKLLEQIAAVRIYLYDSDQHGKGFNRDVYIDLINIGEKSLYRLAEKYEGALVNHEILGNEIIEATAEAVRYKENYNEPLIVRLRHKIGYLKRTIINPS